MATPRTVSLRAYNYLKERPGQVLHYMDIAEALNWDPQSVSTTLGRMVRFHPEFGVRRVGNEQHGNRTGQYIYRSDLVGLEDASAVLNGQRITEPVTPQESLPDTTPNLYEQVGTTVNGEIIVRDTDGFLWRLAEKL